MTPIEDPKCIDCKNYNRLDNNQPNCKAFKLIPIIIWVEGNKHDKPLKDQDNEIVFEPIKED